MQKAFFKTQLQSCEPAAHWGGTRDPRSSSAQGLFPRTSWRVGQVCPAAGRPVLDSTPKGHPPTVLPGPCLMESVERHGGAGAWRKPSHSQRAGSGGEPHRVGFRLWRSRWTEPMTQWQVPEESPACPPHRPSFLDPSQGEESPYQLRHPVLREQET